MTDWNQARAASKRPLPKPRVVNAAVTPPEGERWREHTLAADEMSKVGYFCRTGADLAASAKPMPDEHRIAALTRNAERMKGLLLRAEQQEASANAARELMAKDMIKLGEERDQLREQNTRLLMAECVKMQAQTGINDARILARSTAVWVHKGLPIWLNESVPRGKVWALPLGAFCSTETFEEADGFSPERMDEMHRVWAKTLAELTGIPESERPADPDEGDEDEDEDLGTMPDLRTPDEQRADAFAFDAHMREEMAKASGLNSVSRGTGPFRGGKNLSEWFGSAEALQLGEQYNFPFTPQLEHGQTAPSSLNTPPRYETVHTVSGPLTFRLK